MSKGLVLISGATGFIGTPFVGALLEAGYRVRASVRGLEKSQLLKDLYPSAEGTLEFVVVSDITKATAFREALMDVDYVFHLAGSMVGKGTDLEDYVTPTIDGTLSILNSAREQHSIKKVVIMSSFVSIMPMDAIMQDPYEIKPNTGIDYPVDLHMSFPDGLPGHFMKYQAGKILGHQACRDWVKTNNPPFPVISVHPSQVFGPSLVQNSPSDISGVNMLMWATLQSNGPPMTPYMMVDVRDVVDSLVRMIDADIATGTEVPITGQPYTWKRLANFVKSEYPDLRVPFSPEQEAVMTMDVSLTDRLLGTKWRPMEDTIRAFVDQQVAQTKSRGA